MNCKGFAAIIAVLLLVSLPAAAGCVTVTEAPPPKTDPASESASNFSLSSMAFNEGEPIPVKYSCDGQNVSPPLAWSQPPPETQAFTLIVDDPDAPIGAFTHWVLFNIPATASQLPEGIPAIEQLETGALQGKNGAGKIGYMGPCPPRGSTHRYRFTIYALDSRLDLKQSAFKDQVLKALEGHILAQYQLVGTYQRH